MDLLRPRTRNLLKPQGNPVPTTQITCPSCRTVLQSARPVHVGTPMVCPRCRASYAVRADMLRPANVASAVVPPPLPRPAVAASGPALAAPVLAMPAPSPVGVSPPVASDQALSGTHRRALALTLVA